MHLYTCCLYDDYCIPKRARSRTKHELMLVIRSDGRKVARTKHLKHGIIRPKFMQ